MSLFSCRQRCRRSGWSGEKWGAVGRAWEHEQAGYGGEIRQRGGAGQCQVDKYLYRASRAVCWEGFHCQVDHDLNRAGRAVWFLPIINALPFVIVTVATGRVGSRVHTLEGIPSIDEAHIAAKSRNTLSPDPSPFAPSTQSSQISVVILYLSVRSSPFHWSESTKSAHV